MAIEPLVAPPGMDSLSQSTVAHGHSKRLLALLVLCLIILGLWGAWAYWPNTDMNEAVQAPLSGALILSLAERSLDNTKPVLPYHYIFDKGELRKASVDLVAHRGVELTMQYEISSDTNWMTFIAVQENASSASEFGTAIYRVDATVANSAQTTLEAIQNAKQISNADDKLKRFPVISNSGAVLYMVLEDSSKDVQAPTTAEDWSITLIPAGRMESQKLTSGIYPKWVNESRFIFLKADGLYLYSFNDGSEKKILSIEDGIDTDTMIAYSPTENLIALTLPSKGFVKIFHVEDWDIGGLTFEDEVTMQAFYPTFSSDGQSLAMLIGLVDDSGAAIPYIGIYDLDLSAFRAHPISLMEYDGKSITMSDWVW